MAVPQEKKGDGQSHSKHQKWPEPSLNPGNHREFCLVMSTRLVGKCVVVRKGGGAMSAEFRLQLVINRVLKENSL